MGDTTVFKSVKNNIILLTKSLDHWLRNCKSLNDSSLVDLRLNFNGL